MGGNAELGAQQSESPSAFAGVVSNIEALPAAIQEIRNEHKREVDNSAD